MKKPLKDCPGIVIAYESAQYGSIERTIKLKANKTHAAPLAFRISHLKRDGEKSPR